jgi:teichoic acid transport system permease protein
LANDLEDDACRAPSHHLTASRATNLLTLETSNVSAREPLARRPDAPLDGAPPELHVFLPHPIGLPPMRKYLRTFWQRRHFAYELARANLRVQHFNTALGQLWLVMNPLLLALIYFILVEIIGGSNRGMEFLAHLMLGLFAFRLVSTSVTQGARSVVRGGRLILNTAFPRTLLPLSSVLISLMQFLPTLLVYAAVHGIAGLPVTWNLLWTIPIFLLLVVFACGAAMLSATAQVYFRDFANFLPYITRIWLYLSPVLYYASEVPDKFKPLIAVNPLFPLLASLSDVVDQGEAPNPGYMLWGLAWAAAMFIGGALVFISREREFAVRI